MPSLKVNRLMTVRRKNYLVWENGRKIFAGKVRISQKTPEK